MYVVFLLSVKLSSDISSCDCCVWGLTICCLDFALWRLRCRPRASKVWTLHHPELPTFGSEIWAPLHLLDWFGQADGAFFEAKLTKKKKKTSQNPVFQWSNDMFWDRRISAFKTCMILLVQFSVSNRCIMSTCSSNPLTVQQEQPYTWFNMSKMLVFSTFCLTLRRKKYFILFYGRICYHSSFTST